MNRTLGAIFLLLACGLTYAFIQQGSDRIPAPTIWIGVPAECTEIEPGESHQFILVIARSPRHRQDVHLEVDAPAELEPAPQYFTLPAEATSQISLVLHSPSDSKPGRYFVRVTGSTPNGLPARAVFEVCVRRRVRPPGDAQPSVVAVPGRGGLILLSAGIPRSPLFSSPPLAAGCKFGL